MARRKDHSREELTQLAIDSGREIVRADGAPALTARKVATQMGYTPGTLYNLFENIDGLACAINTQTLEAFAVTIQEKLNRTKTPESGLRAICQAYLDLHATELKLWNLVFATPLSIKTEGYHQAVHQVFDQVTETIKPLSKSPIATRQNAKIIWSTLHGICLLQQSGKLDITEQDPPEALLKRFLNQFLKQ
jgi:AcrR family transcriptional regulator